MQHPQSQCTPVLLRISEDMADAVANSKHVFCVLQVYLASASPPVRHPNVYGVDMPTKKEFVATDLSEEEIRKVTQAAINCPAHAPVLSGPFRKANELPLAPYPRLLICTQSFIHKLSWVS